MEIPVENRISIEDGVHTGKIERIEYRHDPYEYTDIYVKVDGSEATIKYSAPSKISEGTKLWNLLSNFTSLEVGKSADVEKILVGKKVKFQTMNQAGKKGGIFANIVADSMKPTK